MKKLINMLLLAFVYTTAFADNATTTTSFLSVLKTLNAQHYVVIKLEYEHHGYEAKVLTSEGFLQEIKFDENGTQISNHDKAPLFSMVCALELVEKAGFSSISSVKITGDHMYKISAVRESDKKELDVTVNAKTGKIDVEQAWWNIF